MTSGIAAPEDAPGSLEGFVGAKDDAHDTTCEPDGDTWITNGQVTNPEQTPVHYRIYVSYLDGDETVGVAQTDLTSVAPDETKEWSTTITSSTVGLRCVLRVERADN